MAISDFEYRFSKRQPIVTAPQLANSDRHWVLAPKEPSPRSRAKKKWWDEKKAREAKEVE